MSEEEAYCFPLTYQVASISPKFINSLISTKTTLIDNSGIISFRKCAHANQTYVRWICKLECYMNVYVYTCVYIHIFVYTYIYTHKHIYIHKASPTES